MTFSAVENLISVRVRAITPAGTGSWSPITSLPVKCECFCFFCLSSQVFTYCLLKKLAFEDSYNLILMFRLFRYNSKNDFPSS